MSLMHSLDALPDTYAPEFARALGIRLAVSQDCQ